MQQAAPVDLLTHRLPPQAPTLWIAARRAGEVSQQQANDDRGGFHQGEAATHEAVVGGAVTSRRSSSAVMR